MPPLGASASSGFLLLQPSQPKRKEPHDGASHGDFVKYPRTPHLFGSKGTDDDKHWGQAESARLIAEPSLIVEEKIDGTNVGIHFQNDGELVLRTLLDCLSSLFSLCATGSAHWYFLIVD